MNVSSLNTIQTQEITRGNGLRKAAGMATPPTLTDDESKMIRKEFSGAKPLTYYKGNGQKQEQMLSGRGMHIDTKI
ncbi:hypothetical protein QA596_04675 [Balneolales bacterium ANBcel1]|nr:hypothetical protein [Balneolales bacterium ANBcel1]